MEMALLMPVLLIVLLGTVEASIAFNQYLEVSNAVRVAARSLAAGRGGATPYTDATGIALASAPTLVPTSLTLTLAVAGSTCASDGACKSALTPAQGSTATVSATYPCNMQLVFVDLTSSCTISFQSAERIELIRIATAARRARRSLRIDRRGALAPVVAVSAVFLFGVAGLGIDVGHALAVRTALQASTDAAAMAAAIDLASNTAAEVTSMATSYSSVGTNNNNSMTGITVTMSPGFPVLKCLTSTGILCANASGANAIVVQQQTDVPTVFAAVFGFPTLRVVAKSTASASGGQPKPLDVMIVLDTTQSMTQSDPNCNGQTKMSCAMNGARIIEDALAPSADYIGLIVFPAPATTTDDQRDYCGATGKVSVAPYSPTPTTYQVVGLSDDYRSSNNATTLNSGSNLVAATGGTSCAGLQPIGGVGTFFADAITQAYTTLEASTHPGTQKVIIVLSDGDASSTTKTVTTTNPKTGKQTTTEVQNQCYLAVQAAQLATNANPPMWVYSLAYQSSTSGCSTDKSPYNNPCYTMANIASDASRFYSDNQKTCSSGVNNVSTLLQAFQEISTSLIPPRLLPDNAT